MSKICTFLVCCFFVFSASASASASDSINVGTSYSLNSKVLNEARSYLVYLPPSYNEGNRHYPVLYVLDGDIHRFKGIVGVVEALSTETLSNQITEVIVVAIPNTVRSKDLTPSILPEWKFNGVVLERFEETGQAKKFLSFLEKELIPTIKKSFRVSEKKILVGESFGGLFSAFVLIHSQSSFSDYLIVDPTALWDNDYLNKEYSVIKNTQTVKANVYFAFANNSNIGEIGITNYQWGSKFASNISENTNDEIKFLKQYFENENHGTVALMAWYNGLRFLLSNPDK